MAEGTIRGQTKKEEEQMKQGASRWSRWMMDQRANMVRFWSGSPSVLGLLELPDRAVEHARSGSGTEARPVWAWGEH